jgi:HK97 gp10 family phage protein
MYKSRLREISAALPIRLDAVARKAADDVADGARENVAVRTGDLRNAIHVEHRGVGEYAVVAGDDKAWYGLLVEHGTRHNPPRPFLHPAAENARAGIQAWGVATLKGL